MLSTSNVLVPVAHASTLQVTEKRHLATGVVGLRLQAPDGGRLPDWTPGAHIDLALTPTVGPSITRQYSLCGERRNSSSYQVAVLRENSSRGGSAYIHDQLQVGELIGVGGPRNNFHLSPAERYVFIAGGIGITPLLTMIEAATVLGTPWTLLYGGRTRESMAFADDLEKAHGDRVIVRPQDEYGLLDLSEVLTGDRTGTQVYCCGPAPLLAALEHATTDWAPGTVRTERFVPLQLSPPVRSSAFEVELPRSGKALSVDPGESILDALGRAGTHVLSSCREGLCGTCEVGVLEGTPDHRDSLLNDAERARSDCMFVCVSRSISDRLVLDL